ncbi:MAG TPA: hypothetical protein VMV49_07125 [Candidatus Deferrimicrobium sp.]|nr:hypothetical protein [Candidatus Deferrimicrobium sp.]
MPPAPSIVSGRLGERYKICWWSSLPRMARNSGIPPGVVVLMPILAKTWRWMPAARSTVLERHTVLDRGPRQPEIGRWSSLRRMARSSGILHGAVLRSIMSWAWR